MNMGDSGEPSGGLNQQMIKSINCKGTLHRRRKVNYINTVRVICLLLLYYSIFIDENVPPNLHVTWPIFYELGPVHYTPDMNLFLFV